MWAALLLYWTAVTGHLPGGVGQAPGAEPTDARRRHPGHGPAHGPDHGLHRRPARPAQPTRCAPTWRCWPRTAAGPRADGRHWTCGGTRSRTSPATSTNCPVSSSAPTCRPGRRSDEVLLPRQPGPDRPRLRLRHRGTVHPARPPARRPLRPRGPRRACHRRPPGVQGHRRRARRRRRESTPSPSGTACTGPESGGSSASTPRPARHCRPWATAAPSATSDEDVPPYTPDQVIDFYDECGFDLGISVDHVIFGYDPAADHDPHHPQLEQWQARQQTHP